jgi:hypothetical protein
VALEQSAKRFSLPVRTAASGCTSLFRRLIPPKSLKPIRCQLRITYCVLDVAVAKPCLGCPRIVAGVRQGETAGVPEHVRVDRKRYPGALAEACDQCVEALGRHRAALVILVGGIGASSPSAAAGNSGTTAADDCYADAPAALRRLISSISSASELVCAM